MLNIWKEDAFIMGALPVQQSTSYAFLANFCLVVKYFLFSSTQNKYSTIFRLKKGTKIKIACAFLFSPHCLWEANKYSLLACEDEYQKSKSRTHKIKASLSHSYINGKTKSSLQQLFMYSLWCICISVLVQARNCSKITTLHTVTQQQSTQSRFLWGEVTPETPSRRTSNVPQPQMGIRAIGPG